MQWKSMTLKNKSSTDELARAALLESGTVHLGTNYNQLFTVEEAFVRLGQSRQTGELLILNKDESIHVYVDNGFIVEAKGTSEEGEAAVIHALNLEASNFVWAAEVKPMKKDLKLDIRQYVLRHSLNRDQQIAQSLMVQKRETLALPRTDSKRLGHKDGTEDMRFYFVSSVDPMGKIRIKKAITLVGREIYCDWAIEDARISRRHCVLQTASRGILVRDLQATNGTFINGNLVADGYMKPGDKLSLGGYMLTLGEDKATETPPILKMGRNDAGLVVAR